MIDLHTHTSYSDGTWDVRKLLEEAQKAKIEVLAITDHDTIRGLEELEQIDYKKIFKGKIIPGIEFSTVYDGIFFHLLAYEIDYKKIKDWVCEKYENRKPKLDIEFNQMISSCKRNNIKIGDIKYEKEKGWPIDIIYPEIKKYEENKKYFKQEEWDNINVFFEHCVTDKKFPVYVDFSCNYPTADIVAKKVRQAYGKLFVAHPYRYNLEDTIGFLDTLKKNKIIDGVEVYHSSFTKEQSSTLKKYCKENNLLMSGGTDCHGEKRKEIKIGIGYGNLKIEKEIIDDWN